MSCGAHGGDGAGAVPGRASVAGRDLLFQIHLRENTAHPRRQLLQVSEGLDRNVILVHGYGPDDGRLRPAEAAK